MRVHSTYGFPAKVLFAVARTQSGVDLIPSFTVLVHSVYQMCVVYGTLSRFASDYCCYDNERTRFMYLYVQYSTWIYGEYIHVLDIIEYKYVLYNYVPYEYVYLLVIMKSLPTAYCWYRNLSTVNTVNFPPIEILFT